MTAFRFGHLFRGVVVYSLCALGAWRGSYGLSAPEPVPPIVDSESEASDGTDKNLPEAPVAQGAVTVKGLPLAILKDQVPIWTSPVRVRVNDLVWLLPLGAATGVTLSTDTDTMRRVPVDHTYNKDNVNVSNAVLAGEIAIPVVLFGTGVLSENDHAHETGVLSGEALADAVIVEEVFKVAFRRQRPLYNNAAGNFFSSGPANNSFPSSHSTIAWATAAVIAGEYPSIWKEAGIYTAATAVSLTRVLGQEHFPTDVLVGGAVGWLVGHYVLKRHSQYRTAYGLHPRK
ncbi:MAG: phosphatase PAP2 family protein [Silvibacterium sp.]|nr:phosphatase PAP2 family protein [Silvibacterium sp.]